MNLEKIYQANKKIYPPKDQVYRAVDLCPLEKAKVIIIGQDPYHRPNQANGLAFSVNKETPLPPSLKNIFKELKNDLGIECSHGDLSRWAKQGVLLLNTVLTVEEGKPGSHYNLGWEKFTDGLIRALNERPVTDPSKALIFVLWGKKAQDKKKYIDNPPHYVLEAPHPSPFSANNGFFGCRHFSKINDILLKMGKRPIDWRL